MPAIQTPRTHGYATDAIAGKPAPTKPAPAVGAWLVPAMQTPRTHGYPTDVIAGKPAPTEPAPAVGAWLVPAMQTPRTHGYPTDAIAGKPAPTKPAPACRSRACPRCKRRELAIIPPTPSQASQLQQSPRQPVGAGLARDAAAAHSRTPHRRHRRQASSNRARASL